MFFRELVSNEPREGSYRTQPDYFYLEIWLSRIPVVVIIVIKNSRKVGKIIPQIILFFLSLDNPTK
jgi:hypothetical protein